MKHYRFYTVDGQIIVQHGFDFRDAVQNQGFTDDELNNISRWEEVND